MSSRWSSDPDVPRGERYDERFARLADSGADMHGEADLVASLLGDRESDNEGNAGGGEYPTSAATGRRSVLDAGCGTGRVAIELQRRGFDVTGADLDPGMLDAARAKAPELPWHQVDLATLDLGRRFDAVVLAGNVLIFVDPGTEAAVVARCADHLVPGGLLVCGFQIRTGGFQPLDLDRAATSAGLILVDRWATWQRKPWYAGDNYQVSVHYTVDA